MFLAHDRPEEGGLQLEQGKGMLVVATRRVLLVGGAGYVGTSLTERLLAQGYEVVVLDNLLYGQGDCLSVFEGQANFRLIIGDMRDQRCLDKAMKGTTDAVLLAGLVGEPITTRYPKEADEVNNSAIRLCIDTFGRSDVERVIFISTCSNYGIVDSGQPADERHPLMPLSDYAKAKVDVEHYLEEQSRTADYVHTILRFATAFGVAPRMRFDLTVNEFTRELALGRELKVYDPHTWRPYCHVRDFGHLIELVLEAPVDLVKGEVFNAGGDANNSTKQGIIDLLLSIVPGARVRLVDGSPDPRDYRVSFAKVRQSLGFEPTISIEGGIQELIDSIAGGSFGADHPPNGQWGNYEIADVPI